MVATALYAYKASIFYDTNVGKICSIQLTSGLYWILIYKPE